MRARHCKGKLRLVEKKEERGEGIWGEGRVGRDPPENHCGHADKCLEGQCYRLCFFKYLFYFLCVSVLPVWIHVHCVCAVFVEVREGHLLPWNCPGIAVNCHVGAGNEI